MARDIVIGYDGTDGAKAALSHAIALAKELGDRLVIVFGYEPGLVGGEVQDLRAAIKELGDERLHEAEREAQAAGVQVDLLLVEARAVDGLVQVASERDARMIVVGCYGERPLTGAILGSTPHRLLYRSSVPVLVVPIEP